MKESVDAMANLVHPTVIILAILVCFSFIMYGIQLFNNKFGQ